LLENSSTPTAPPTSYPSLLSAYPFETSQEAGIPRNYYIDNTTDWGPRFGFAWRPFGGSKTALRGGYGIFYNFIGAELGTLEMTFNPPFRIGPTYATNLPAHAPAGGYQPDLTLANPFPITSGAPAGNPLIYFTPRNIRNPMQQQWTLTLEQQLGQEWMVRGSYVGSQVQHMYWYAFNINQPAIQQPNVILQTQRPFQPWGNINDDGGPGGIQNFDQLQLEVIKRFTNGLSFQLEYNWTRSLDDVPVAAGLNNPWCYRCDYAPSDYLSPQRLVFNYVYELPFGNGRHWMNKKGVADAVLGGWEFAGITSYIAGAPSTGTSQLAFNVPSSVIGWWGGRPDRVAGVPLYGGQQNSHDIVDGVQWFNPSAFAPPQEWQYGDAARNSIWVPGGENWDMSFMKTFTLRESLKLQLRTDWFDAFNHMNLGSPDFTMGDTRDGGLAVATFGKIYSQSTSYTCTACTGNRVIQMALRLMF
jgi:hypothetical protein